MTTPDTAEIKINVEDRFAAVRAALAMPGGSSGELYFLDDLTPGLPESLPLLRAGIVLRIRSKNGKGDVTVKLRPCRRSQLPPHWVDVVTDEGKGTDVEYKSEQDWSGRRHSLAVSAVVKVSADDISSAIGGHRAASLFMSKQLDFLHDCGTIFINPGRLTPLGPIKITRWKEIPLANLQLNAERWRLGDLDVVELSIVSPLDEAADRQAEFLAAVSRAGLSPRTEQSNKTETFLAALAKNGT